MKANNWVVKAIEVLSVGLSYVPLLTKKGKKKLLNMLTGIRESWLVYHVIRGSAQTSTAVISLVLNCTFSSSAF